MEKTEINTQRIFRMISPVGFINIFNDDIKLSVKRGEIKTHEQIFDRLNEEYHQATGKFRYKNFQSFKTIKYK